MSRRSLPCALLLLAGLGGRAGGQDVPPIEFAEFTLDNGLHFIVHEDH